MIRKVRLALALCIVMAVRDASAFDPVTVSLATWFVTYVGAPVSYCLGCAFAYSPPIRAFGTEDAVYGLDWGSLACHARDVYGLQMSFCGGSFEHRLYGLQLGILASGYAQQDLPFGDYHFCNPDFGRLYGLQFGTFAAKAATVNGVQLSAVYAEATTVNGLQFGLVTSAKRLRGLQVGLFNSAADGCGAQVGVVNCAGSGLAGCLPVLNFVF